MRRFSGRGPTGVATLFAILLSVITTVVEAGGLYANKIVYEAPTRMSKAIIDKGVWTSNEVAPLVPLPSEGNSRLYEVVGHKVIICSDSRYRCIESWGRTLAVPRALLRLRQKYKKRGVLFQVEECLRGSARRCQVALISGICGHTQSVRETRCLTKPLSGSGPNAVYNYVVYFVYNEDFGITAFGVTDRVETTEAGMLAIATQMILMSQTGLLRE